MGVIVAVAEHSALQGLLVCVSAMLNTEEQVGSPVNVVMTSVLLLESTTRIGWDGKVPGGVAVEVVA